METRLFTIAVTGHGVKSTFQNIAAANEPEISCLSEIDQYQRHVIGAWLGRLRRACQQLIQHHMDSLLKAPSFPEKTIDEVNDGLVIGCEGIEDSITAHNNIVVLDGSIRYCYVWLADD